MPGLGVAKDGKTPKKLKQAQLPFKILSPVTPTATSGTSKTHSVKKRPFTKDESAGSKTTQPKKPKTSTDSECVEVSSSSDEPRATSPRRRPRAPLDQFVRIESPAPEVSTSCDVVDLTSEDKENVAEQPAKDVEMTDDVKAEESGDGDVKTKATGDAEEVEKTAAKRKVDEPASGDVPETKKRNVSEPSKAKIDDDKAADKTPNKDSDKSSEKAKSSDDLEKTPASNTEKTKTDSKSDSSSGVVSSETDPAKKSLPEARTDQGTDGPSEKESDDASSESEDQSSAEQPTVPTVTVSEAEDVMDTTKTPEPTTEDVSDSDKDGDDDDDSADDVEVLDDSKLKPSQEGVTNGTDTTNAPGGSTTPSTKATGVTRKKTPKQKERERIRAKREQEKLEEKQRRQEEKEKLRKEKEEQKEKERKEKQEKREKERKEKEEKKEKERLEKEKEKLEKQKQKEAEKQKLIDEKKQAKEEERNRKEEEKRKAEEEEQRKLQKAKSMFSSFFVKKPKDAEAEQEEQKDEADTKLFQEFRVKEDMVLAPGARTALSAGQSSRLERALAASELTPREQLYLAELRDGTRRPQTRSRTLPPLQKELEIIEEDEDEDRELDGLAQNIVLSSSAARTSRRLRYKLLMFHENRRPAYWGTWSKRSSDVTARRPLGKAQILNYEEDSDDDWEEEDPNGESLSGSEKEVESEDDYEVDNEYFVPHGYLSDEEIRDEEEMISPEAQKARLKEKGEEFEKQMKKKTTALKPKLIGCVWRDDSNTDPMFQQLLKLLRPFAVRPLSTLPVPTVASGEVAGPSPLAGPSPSETPQSSAQTGPKFLKKFPDEGLLPLARLVHGSTRGKPLLVREFAAFWKRRCHGGSPRKTDPTAAAAGGQTPPSAADAPPAGAGGPLQLSKKKIEDKLCAIASYTRCTAEGPLQGRCCWLVNDDVLATLDTQLPIPSQWKWITKTAARRSHEGTPGVSPAMASPAVTPGAGTTTPVPMVTTGAQGVRQERPQLERPRAATSLITKFTKVVTAEQARQELLSPPPAKRKIVPTKLISPQGPVPGQPAQKGIATFFKASPSAGPSTAGPSTAGSSTASPSTSAAGPSTSAAAAGGTPKRRVSLTPVGPRPGLSSATTTPTAASAAAGAPAARRLTPTAVSGGAAAQPRRLTPTAVQPAARRLVPTPVAAGSGAKTLTPATATAAPVVAQAQAPALATTAQHKGPSPVARAQAAPTTAVAAGTPEQAPRKITLISLPRGLELAKAAAVAAPVAQEVAATSSAQPTKVAADSADVEMITLD